MLSCHRGYALVDQVTEGVRLTERVAGIDVSLEAIVATSEVFEVVTVDAARVREQMTDRDLLGDVGIGDGEIRKVRADGRVYVEDLITKAAVNTLANPGARPKVEGKERVLCLDAKTGNELWKHEQDVTYEISYPSGPRCKPHRKSLRT